MKWLRWVFLVAASVLFVLYLQGQNRAPSLPRDFSAVFLVAAAATNFSIPYARAWRLRYFLASLGSHQWRGISRVSYINEFVGGVLPLRMNVPVKAWLLNRVCGAPLKESIAVVTFEQLQDFGLYMGVALLAVPVLVSQAKVGFAVPLLLLGLGVLFLLLPDRFWERMARIRPLVLPSRIWSRLVGLLRDLRRSWIQMSKSRAILPALVFMAAVFLLQILHVEFLLMAAGSFIPLHTLTAIVFSAGFLGTLSGIPAGLGVTDAAYYWFFLQFSVPPEAALFTVVMGRLFTIFLVIVGYFLSLQAGLSRKELRAASGGA